MSVIDTATTVYDLLKKGASIEVQEQLMKLREEALALQEENFKLRQRLSDLEAEAANVEALHFEEPVYWRIEGETKDGPYCQQCFDSGRKLIRLQSGQSSIDGRAMRWWDCRTCRTHYSK